MPNNSAQFSYSRYSWNRALSHLAQRRSPIYSTSHGLSVAIARRASEPAILLDRLSRKRSAELSSPRLAADATFAEAASVAPGTRTMFFLTAAAEATRQITTCQPTRCATTTDGITQQTSSSRFSSSVFGFARRSSARRRSDYLQPRVFLPIRLSDRADVSHRRSPSDGANSSCISKRRNECAPAGQSIWLARLEIAANLGRETAPRNRFTHPCPHCRRAFWTLEQLAEHFKRRHPKETFGLK